MWKQSLQTTSGTDPKKSFLWRGVVAAQVGPDHAHWKSLFVSFLDLAGDFLKLFAAYVLDLVGADVRVVASSATRRGNAGELP